jgi:hypothetical protein
MSETVINDKYLERRLNDMGEKIMALERRIKQLEGKDAPTIPIYDSSNWPDDAVEGQIVIAPVA